MPMPDPVHFPEPVSSPIQVQPQHPRREDEFARDIPPPDSDAWQPHVPQSPVKQYQQQQVDEFSFNLPPPNSSMWETMTPQSATPGTRQKTRRGAH